MWIKYLNILTVAKKLISTFKFKKNTFDLDGKSFYALKTSPD